MPATKATPRWVATTVNFEPDVYAWLKARGERADRPFGWVIRQVLRDAMEREQAEEHAA